MGETSWVKANSYTIRIVTGLLFRLLAEYRERGSISKLSYLRTARFRRKVSTASTNPIIVSSSSGGHTDTFTPWRTSVAAVPVPTAAMVAELFTTSMSFFPEPSLCAVPIRMVTCGGVVKTTKPMSPLSRGLMVHHLTAQHGRSSGGELPREGCLAW